MNSLARLRELISDADHAPLCTAMHRNVVTGDFIGGDCDCWKVQAQQEVDITWAAIQHHQRFVYNVGRALNNNNALKNIRAARENLQDALRELFGKAVS